MTGHMRVWHSGENVGAWDGSLCWDDTLWGGGNQGGGSSEPVYTAATDTIVHAANSSLALYSSATADGAATDTTTPRVAPFSSPIYDGLAVNESITSIIAGKGGTGVAFRTAYPLSASQDGGGWVHYKCGSYPALKTSYIRAQLRINGTFSTNVAVKFFHLELFNVAGGLVPQWSTHDASPWSGGAKTTYWQCYDTGYTDSVDPYPTGHDQATQPVGPYFQDLMGDGLWHRFLWVYRPHSAAGVYDGIMQLWIDGTLVINMQASSVGVTPTGGAKQWTSPDMLHNMNVNIAPDPTYGTLFGGTQSSLNVPTWSLDVNCGDGNAANLDTLLWWYR